MMLSNFTTYRACEEVSRCTEMISFGPVPVGTPVVSLLEYISYFGVITKWKKCILGNAEDARSFFLLVAFEFQHSARELVESSPHYITYQRYYASQAYPIKEDAVDYSVGECPSSHPHQRSIHLKGVKSTMEKEALKIFLESFGLIQQFRMIRGHDYAFVSFKHEFVHKFLLSLKKVVFCQSNLWLNEASKPSEESPSGRCSLSQLPKENTPGCSTELPPSLMAAPHQERRSTLPNWTDRRYLNSNGRFNNSASSVEDSSDQSYEREANYPGRLDFDDSLTSRDYSLMAREDEQSEGLSIEITQTITTTIRLKKNGIYYQKKFEDSNDWVYYSSSENMN